MKTIEEIFVEYLFDPDKVELPPEMCEREDSEDWIEKRIREARGNHDDQG